MEQKYTRVSLKQSFNSYTKQILESTIYKQYRYDTKNRYRELKLAKQKVFSVGYYHCLFIILWRTTTQNHLKTISKQ